MALVVDHMDVKAWRSAESRSAEPPRFDVAVQKFQCSRPSNRANRVPACQLPAMAADLSNADLHLEASATRAVIAAVYPFGLSDETSRLHQLATTDRT